MEIEVDEAACTPTTGMYKESAAKGFELWSVIRTDSVMPFEAFCICIFSSL